MSDNKKLQVHTSPLTNTIFCGKILKDGLWATNKQDVTMQALLAVISLVKNFGKPVEIRTEDGKLEYRITLEDFTI